MTVGAGPEVGMMVKEGIPVANRAEHVPCMTCKSPCLCLPSHRRSSGLLDVCRCVRLYIISGNLNSHQRQQTLYYLPFFPAPIVSFLIPALCRKTNKQKKNPEFYLNHLVQHCRESIAASFLSLKTV